MFTRYNQLSAKSYSELMSAIERLPRFQEYIDDVAYVQYENDARIAAMDIGGAQVVCRPETTRGAQLVEDLTKIISKIGPLISSAEATSNVMRAEDRRMSGNVISFGQPFRNGMSIDRWVAKVKRLALNPVNEKLEIGVAYVKRSDPYGIFSEKTGEPVTQQYFIRSDDEHWIWSRDVDQWLDDRVRASGRRYRRKIPDITAVLFSSGKGREP